MDPHPHNKTKLATNNLNKNILMIICCELVFPLAENYYAPTDNPYPVLEDQMVELFLMVEMRLRFSAQ